MLDALTDWLTHPATWATVLVLGTCGEVAKSLVLGPKSKWPHEGFKGWRGVYVVSFRAHPIIAGSLFGLIPGLPVTDAFHTDGLTGSVMFYGGAGALTMIGYAVIVSNVRSALWNYGKKLAPPPGGTAPSAPPEE